MSGRVLWTRNSHRFGAIAAIALALAVAASVLASSASALASRKRPPISAAAAFSLPSTKTCVSGRALTFKMRKLSGVTWSSVTVSVDGKRFETVRLSDPPRPVKLTGLPSGSIDLKLTARTKDGRHVSTERKYGTCGPEPGSYSGTGYTLYVSPDSTHVEDVSLSPGYYNAPACQPSGTIGDDTSFFIPRIAINADGSFGGTATQKGVENGAPATFKYMIKGRFHGTSASGSVRENVTYDDGTSYSCTTGTTPWTMTRDTQGTQKATPPPPGSYSGDGYTFYVAAGSAHIQDVSLAPAYHDAPACVPSGTIDDDTSFYIPQIAINADGSFSGSASQTGVENGAAATFTYTFSGHFHGTDTNGAERAAGSLRENVTYDDGTSYSCTTGTTPWTMTRETQGTQAATPPPPGSYSGDGYMFYVSPDSTKIQDVSLAPAYHATPACVPSGTIDDDTSFYIPQIAINSNGSFSGTASQMGVENGAAATFTYTFSGHFHGTNSGGTERAAGSLREDVTYDDGTSYSCTTATTPWTMTRETQGTQAAAPPQPGTYSGGAYMFHVSADSSEIQDVTLAPTYHTVLACMPGGASLNDTSFSIPTISIGTNGSFSGSAMQSGTVDGAPATFTYTFSGHFHGTDSNGHERAAGSLREDVTYDNGTSYSCTTGTEPWAMTRTGS